MSDPVDGLIRWAQSREYRQRTVVPGMVVMATDGARERTADFQTGIADLVAGQPAPDAGPTPDAPVMQIVAGGFFMLLPTLPGDESLGLVCDRANTTWRESRTPGLADQLHGKRTKALHDIMLTPFAITAPPSAPPTWDHLVIGGPAGVAIEVAIDGTVTISKTAPPAATITIDAAGGIAITVETGQTVKIGDDMAEALVKLSKLLANLDSAIAAAVATPPTPMAGNNGSLAFTNFKTAWEAAKASNPMGTIKTLGS